MSAWPFPHVLAALALGTALGACFNPPAAATMFACDPATAPACPSGYRCEADGCCHRDGSDVAAELGSCRLGGPGTAATGSDASTAADTGTNATDASTTGTASATDTASTTGTATNTTGASTGADTGSSSAGTTGTT